MKQLNNSTISPEAVCGELLLDVVPLVMAAVRVESRPAKPPELTAPQFRALAFIDRHDGLSLSAVADMLGLTLSSVSKLMEGLVSGGYVRHETCPYDRRRARLHSTARGKATMTRARRQVSRTLAEHLACLSPQQLEETVTGLRHLQSVFRPAPAPKPAGPDRE